MQKPALLVPHATCLHLTPYYAFPAHSFDPAHSSDYTGDGPHNFQLCTLHLRGITISVGLAAACSFEENTDISFGLSPPVHHLDLQSLQQYLS